MTTTAQWTIFETALPSSSAVHFASPSGRLIPGEAFWDGGSTWRVRFSPDELGEWSWHTDHAEGAFTCVPYEGDNPLYRHGALRLSEDRRHFVHADGAPFFWLADTAWNGVLKAQPADWERYLQARQTQEFTAIQFVCAQWRGCSKDPSGEVAFTHDPTACHSDRSACHPEQTACHSERTACHSERSEESRRSSLTINPAFFQRLDAKVAAINDHGLLAAPVILWALTEVDPGVYLSLADAITVARYIVARYGAYQVAWFLGGDGHYEGQDADRWRAIGQAVFGMRHDRLVTMHPCGQSWVADEFRDQEWFDFIGYQSGHGDAEGDLRWLTEGPPTQEWLKTPPRPIINLEPNYETHISYHSRRRFTDYEVRRAAYWSLLVAPTAGVTYGINATWCWHERPEVPEAHEALGVVGPWSAGLESPGLCSMTILRRFLAELPWFRLRPAPHLLAEQPGHADPECHLAAATTADADHTVIYLPCGGSVVLRDEALARGRARWFNPAKGEWQEAAPDRYLRATFIAPDRDDWLLHIS